MNEATVAVIVGGIGWVVRELAGRWLTERNLRAVTIGIGAAKAALESARASGWNPRDARVVDDIAERLERAGLRGTAISKAFEVAERELATAMLHAAFEDLGRRVDEFKQSSSLVPIDELVRRKRASAPPSNITMTELRTTTPVTVDLDAPAPPKGVIR